MIHSISPGLWCVPAAIQAITGADPESVIQPAINRAERNPDLLGLVTGVRMSVATNVLRELGWNCRRYKGQNPLRAQVRTWARRYTGHIVLISTKEHALVLNAGRVYDSWTPHGEEGDKHPYSHALVHNAWLIQKSNPKSAYI